MRLLQLLKDGRIISTEDLLDNIPPYAILSHSWGAEDEELTFRELIDGTGLQKAQKVRFCGEQAARDGLQYFWVDTCCNIQTHHLRQCPMKRVAYAAENGGSWYIAF